MAYLDLSQFADPIGPTRAPAAAFLAAKSPVETLTALEWRVVELARGDGLETLRPRGRRSWLSRLVLGPMPPSPMLADERLEALRRLAVQAWHSGYTLPASAIKQAVAAGFSEFQVGKVIDTIVGRRHDNARIAA